MPCSHQIPARKKFFYVNASTIRCPGNIKVFTAALIMIAAKLDTI